MTNFAGIKKYQSDVDQHNTVSHYPDLDRGQRLCGPARGPTSHVMYAEFRAPSLLLELPVLVQRQAGQRRC